MNVGITVIKYLLFWRFNLLLKDKLGQLTPPGEHCERNHEMRDKCSYPPQVIVESSG
jgi:hypothetical protein